MPELENVEKVKTAGYMSRSRTTNQDRIKKDEEELKQLKKKLRPKKQLKNQEEM